MTIVLLHLREEVAIWGCQDKFKSIFLDGSHPHCGLVRLSIVLMEENSNPLNLLDRLLQDISLIWNYCDPTCVPATAPPFHPTKLRSLPCVQISLIWSIRSSSMVVNFWRTLEDLPQKKLCQICFSSGPKIFRTKWANILDFWSSLWITAWKHFWEVPELLGSVPLCCLLIWIMPWILSLLTSPLLLLHAVRRDTCPLCCHHVLMDLLQW